MARLGNGGNARRASPVVKEEEGMSPALRDALYLLTYGWLKDFAHMQRLVREMRERLRGWNPKGFKLVTQFQISARPRSSSSSTWQKSQRSGTGPRFRFGKNRPNKFEE
jgi:hypothetical protein